MTCDQFAYGQDSRAHCTTEHSSQPTCVAVRDRLSQAVHSSLLLLGGEEATKWISAHRTGHGHGKAAAAPASVVCLPQPRQPHQGVGQGAASRNLQHG